MYRLSASGQAQANSLNNQHPGYWKSRINQPAPGKGRVSILRYDGVNWTTYTGPFVLPDGVYTFYYRSQDKKGNLEGTKQQSFKIDTLPPVITITQPAAGNYTHSSTLTLNYTVTDGPASGLGAGVSCGLARDEGFRADATLIRRQRYYLDPA